MKIFFKKTQQLEDKNSTKFLNMVNELRSKKDKKNLSDSIETEIWKTHSYFAFHN